MSTFAMEEDSPIDSISTGDFLGPPQGKSPNAKSRSMSAGEANAPKLSPSPQIVQGSRPTSKDDIDIKESPQPATPRRSEFNAPPTRTPRQFTPPPPLNTANTSGANVKPAPLSPKLDHSQIYASPTNILPRRSRGLDFSRAATSLHHSTLAEQSSPESSPTVGGRAINIPGRRGGYGGPEQTSSSLWSVMGNQERMNISSSLGSTQAMGSETSSSSDDDLMEDDMDESYVTTPQVHKTSSISIGPFGGLPFGSPAMGSPASFQHRQRSRKSIKKKMRGPLGLGFNIATASLSRSPPANSARSRRESISWQANQLQISPTEGEDGSRSHSDADGVPSEAQIRRVVARRNNLLVSYFFPSPFILFVITGY